MFWQVYYGERIVANHTQWMQQLKGVRSKLDANSVYWQIPPDEVSESLNFSTHHSTATTSTECQVFHKRILHHFDDQMETDVDDLLIWGYLMINN